MVTKADVKIRAQYFLEEIYPRLANADTPLGLKTYAKDFATRLLEDDKPSLKPAKGVVNGHIMDVWIEDTDVEEAAIETPAAKPARRLVFDLTTRDLLKVKEITLNGVIDGKLARGDYEEQDLRPVEVEAFRRGAAVEDDGA